VCTAHPLSLFAICERGAATLLPVGLGCAILHHPCACAQLLPWACAAALVCTPPILATMRRRKARLIQPPMYNPPCTCSVCSDPASHDLPLGTHSFQPVLWAIQGACGSCLVVLNEGLAWCLTRQNRGTSVLRLLSNPVLLGCVQSTAAHKQSIFKGCRGSSLMD